MLRVAAQRLLPHFLQVHALPTTAVGRGHSEPRVACSAFPDTDTCFGSVGDFFDFHPRTGSFQCNPPFVDEVMTQTARHIDGLLRASTAPLSFIVIVPAWQGDCQSYLLTTTSPFLRHTKRLMRKQHQCVSSSPSPSYS